MATATPEQIHWLETVTGKNGDGGVVAEAKDWDDIQKKKAAALERMNRKLDELREIIREGQDYRLKKKGVRGALGGKIKAIESEDKTIEEVESEEDLVNTVPLSPELQKKLMEAQREVVELQQSLQKETVSRNGKEEPLFSDPELSDEVWTPLMRERLLPDNAIPAKYSKVQQFFEGSAKMYVAKLNSLAEPKKFEDLDWGLGIAKDSIGVLGDVTQLVEGLVPDCPKVAATITKGVQTALTAGISVVQAGFARDWDKGVEGMASVLSSTLSFYNKDIARIVSGSFRAAGKGAGAAKVLAEKGVEGIPEALSFLGDAVTSSFSAGTKDTSANNHLVLTGKIIASALTAQKGAVTAIIEARTKGKKPDVNTILGAILSIFSRTAATYLDVKHDFDKAAEDEKVKKAQGDFMQALKDDKDNPRAKEALELFAQAKNTTELVKGTELQDRAMKAAEEALGKGNPALKAYEDELKVSATIDSIASSQQSGLSGLEKSIAGEVGAGAKRLKGLQDFCKSVKPQDIEDLKKRLDKVENEKAAAQITEANAQFKAMLDDFMTEATDPGDDDEAAAAKIEHDTHTIEQLMRQIQADRQILETVKLLSGSVNIAAQFVPQMQSAVAFKEFVFSALAAAERIAQLVHWGEVLKDSQAALSPVADAVQNFIKNNRDQLAKYTVNAIMQMAQGVGGILACIPHTAAAGVAVQKAAQAGQAVNEIIHKIKTKAEMEYQWKIFKQAYANPKNRRKGRQALRGNPTLSKYAIAYGAYVLNEPMAVRAVSSIGLTAEVLAHESTDVDKVVQYLEVYFEEDPKLLKPMPDRPKFFPKGKLELTAGSWSKVKTAAVKSGGLDPKQSTDLIDGALARLFKAEEHYQAQRTAEKLVKADLEVCMQTVDIVAAALSKYEPQTAPHLVTRKQEPHEEMKKYVLSLKDLATFRKAELERDFNLYEEEQRAKKEKAEQEEHDRQVEEFAKVRDEVSSDLEALRDAGAGEHTKLSGGFEQLVQQAVGGKLTEAMDGMKKLDGEVKAALKKAAGGTDMDPTTAKEWKAYLKVRGQVTAALKKLKEAQKPGYDTYEKAFEKIDDDNHTAEEFKGAAAKMGRLAEKLVQALQS